MDPSKEVFCNSAKSITELTDSFALLFRFGGGRLMTICQFESNIYFQQLVRFPKTQHTGTLERETDAKGHWNLTLIPSLFNHVQSFAESRRAIPNLRTDRHQW